MDIADKVAVVTGGASGLGEATVERLVSAEARVAIFDLDVERGQALAGRHPGRAIFAKVDVANEADAEAGFAAIREAFGALHICVNCAGIPGKSGRTVGKTGPLALSEFRRVVDVNLVGTFNICRLAAAEMLKNARRWRRRRARRHASFT